MRFVDRFKTMAVLYALTIFLLAIADAFVKPGLLRLWMESAIANILVIAVIWLISPIVWRVTEGKQHRD